MSTIAIDLRMAGTSGGIARYSAELSRAIAQLKPQHQFVALMPERGADDLAQDLEGSGYFTVVRCSERHYSLSEQLWLPRRIAQTGAALTHFTSFNVPVFMKKPFVTTIHDVVHHRLSGRALERWHKFQAYKLVIGKAIENSAHVLTVSEYSKQEIVETFGISAERVTVTYEGTSLPVATPSETSTARELFRLTRPYFIAVGVLEPKKNIEQLCRGFALLCKKFGTSHDLVIVGNTDKHHPGIRLSALSQSRRDRTVFTGYASDSQLSALYGGATAYVSASTNEGFGLPGVEAMATGLPLVVANTPVYNEIYDDGAVYFDASSVQDIAEKLELVARDGAYRTRLSERAKKRSEDFSWKQCAEKTLEVYERALHGGAV